MLSYTRSMLDLANKSQQQAHSVHDYVLLPIVQGHMPTPKEHLVVKKEPGMVKEQSTSKEESRQRKGKGEYRREEQQQQSNSRGVQFKICVTSAVQTQTVPICSTIHS